MAGLSWVHWLGLLLAVASSGAQIFPFSNLKHMFEQKGKAGQGAARAPPPVTTPSPLGSPGFVPTLEPSTTTLEPTTTVGPVSGLAPYYGPYSLFDEDDGYREFQRPDLVVTERARPLPKASKPTAAAKPKHQAAATHPKYSPSATKQTPPSRLAASKPTATAAAGQQAKHKKRLVESHLHAVPPAGRPSHYVPIKIAYEPTTPSGLPAGDVHVLPAASAGPAGDGRPLLPPPLYLTPPRLPNPVPVDASPSSSAPHAVLEAIDAAASSHPTSASSPSAAAAAPIPMPPVPAVYLRPPGPPGPSGPPEPVLFKHSGVDLQLADVADAALSHSTNPGILKTARPQARPANSTPATPANHKLTSAPHNALQAGAVPGPSKLGAEYTNHYGDKYTKHGPKGAPGNHKPDPTDKPLALSAAESSAAAAIALGPPQRTPANHRPGLRPQPQHQQQLQQQAPRAPKFKNHKQGPVAAPSAPRPVKYHNHRPGSLDGEESSTSLRYRKRPLGPIEQEVASSGIQHTGKYPSSGDGDRVEFQMHGLQGPESYKFGYDTGSGHNRQFRYEERDPHGNVKGHYGYVDEHGKLQIVNYKADPHHGYSADVSKLHT